MNQSAIDGLAIVGSVRGAVHTLTRTQRLCKPSSDVATLIEEALIPLRRILDIADGVSRAPIEYQHCSCGAPLPAGREQCPHCEHLDLLGGRR